MAVTPMTRQAAPKGFSRLPLMRSYATMDAQGNVYRVEVRRDPVSRLTLQVTTAMPDLFAIPG